MSILRQIPVQAIYDENKGCKIRTGDDVCYQSVEYRIGYDVIADEWFLSWVNHDSRWEHVFEIIL